MTRADKTWNQITHIMYVLHNMNDMTLAFFAFSLFWDKLQYHILVQELLYLHGFLASYPRGFKELCLESTAWAWLADISKQFNFVNLFIVVTL